MYGIDISSYQRGIDIRAKGAQFCICKATDGTRFVDKCCDGFVQQCVRAGIPFGVYHFANSPQKSSWEDQAAYFVRNCRGYVGRGVLVLDWEDSTYGGPVRKWGPAGAKAWLDEVYRLTGVRPMIYMSASTCTEWDWSQVARDYALWGAGYRNGATYDDPRTSSYSWGAFRSPVIHQYTESGGLDKNVGYLTAEQWSKFANPGKVPTDQPEQRTGTADAIDADGWVGPSSEEEKLTDADIERIADLAAQKVWSYAIQGTQARDRLYGIDAIQLPKATEGIDRLNRTDDPTGRGYELDTHDHVKWIAAKQAEMDAKLDAITASLGGAAGDAKAGGGK